MSQLNIFKNIGSGLPYLLLLLRLVMGLVFIGMATRPAPPFITMAFLIWVGLFSDVADGIIARKLGLSTIFLRRLDSAVDTVFWICVLWGTYLVSSISFKQHAFELALLFLVYVSTELFSLYRFSKTVALHTILSKIWAISLALFFTFILLNYAVNFAFYLMFWLGIIAQAEIWVILILIKKWEADLPGLYYVWQREKGNEPSKSKWFNS